MWAEGDDDRPGRNGWLPDVIVRRMPPTGIRRITAKERAAYRRLGHAWAGWGIAGGLGLLLTAAALRGEFGPRVGLWLLVNTAALVGILALIRQILPENRSSPDGPLLPALGAGNHVTVLRGVLIAQLPGYLLFPWPGGWAAWLPAVTFGTALAADFADGYFARRADRATRLGERLDIEFDGLGLLAATALAVHYGQLPVVYLLTVGIARYLFLGAGWLARRLGRATREIPPSTARRGLAGAVMELAAAALWPILPSAMMTLAAIIIGIPVLAGFGRDTLVSLGFVDPGEEAYWKGRQRVVWFFSTVVPVALRIAMVIVLGPLLAVHWAEGPSPGVVLGSVLLSMIALGAAGRAAAAGLIVLIGLSLALGELSTEGLAAWGLAVAIYLAGTGAGSLWQPEMALVRRKAGERR